MQESLVKYLAGLLDADGSMSINFRRDDSKHDTYYGSAIIKIMQSDAVDRHGFIMSLPKLTGFGTVHRSGDKGQYASWSVHKRSEIEMLVPRLVKHMVIKAKHWNWILETWRDCRGLQLNEVTRIALTQAVKESRKLRIGPLKPKNYPTWAWLAGYLDGDGHYTIRRCEKDNYTAVRVGAVAHTTDAAVLNFLKESFGGSIKPHGQSENCSVWYRSLGVRDSSFAMMFLGKLARHSRLKRHKIDQIICYHRQRLSELTPAGEAIV